jgi:aspartate aminotransferase
VTEAMRRMKTEDYGVFRKNVLGHTGVSFCTRAHFGRPLPGEREYYIRMAYSGIDVPEIREGLGKFKQYLDSL